MYNVEHADLWHFEDDLFSAMKNKEESKKYILSFLIAEMQNKRIELKRPLTDEEVVSVLSKTIKQQEDTLDLAVKYNRNDNIPIISKQLKILKSYMPKMMEYDELVNEVRTTIEEGKISNIGVAMKTCMSKFHGKAENGCISKAVLEVLNGK